MPKQVLGPWNNEADRQAESGAAAVKVSAQVDRQVLLGSILASSMAFIDGSALQVALPQIQSALWATAADLLWINNSYLLALAALVLAGGSLGDHLGRKRIFVGGIWVFIAGSVACGLSADVDLLIAARLLQGIGAAAMIPGSLALLSTHFGDHDRGRAIGIWSAFTAATAVAGPIIGGLLADASIWTELIGEALAAQMWRGIFFVNLPLAGIALYSLYKYASESRDDSVRGNWPDFGGALLAICSLGSISYSLINSAEEGLEQANGLILLLGLALIPLFIIWELRVKNPMMPMHLYRSPIFTGSNLITLFLYGGLQGAFLFFSLNLIQVQDYPASVAGFVGLPFVAMLILLSRPAGRFADKHGPRLPLIAGSALTGMGFLLMSLPGITEGPKDYWTTYFPGLLAVGVGMGITVAPLTAAAMGSVPKGNAGAASGINNALSRVASVLSVAALGSLALREFYISFASHLAGIDLPADTHQLLLENSSAMGNMEIPSDLPAEAYSLLRKSVELSFVDACRAAMRVAALLAWISSICAFFAIKSVRYRSNRQ